MREYSRVDATIPLGITVIGEDEKDMRKARIAGDMTFGNVPAEEPTDRALAEWLKIINSKLDYLINLWSFHQEGFSCLPIYEVNISGGGMSFNSDVCYEEGKVLELKTVLESPSSIALYLYGEVVKCEKLKDKDKFRVALKFINIDEDIRDHIIRFVFHRQRQILRQKREIK
ncbi:MULTISPECIES: PilZ domain-containing protein [Thermodesulfovibrio]|nr:PilZ domain-containing protein [Thermodesulfovibrio sp.]